jgi:hypothetical protein
VCCPAAGNNIGAAGATALAAALQKNTTVTEVNLECAQACSRARVAAGDGGAGDACAHGRGPPRRHAQCAGRERERAFARPRASGSARPASSVGPRAFSCELPLRVCFGLEWCGADLGSGSRVCCPAAVNSIGDDVLKAVYLLLKRNKKMAAEKAAAEKEAAEKEVAEKEVAEKEVAEKAAAAKKAADEKAEAEKVAASERARALDPMGSADLFWKTRYRFSVPQAITEQTTNYVKGIVRSRLPTGVPFEDVYPKVVISYASGRRPQDCEGAGPGMFYAADLLEFLHERRVPAFSGLHVPPGKDWKVFMLRLEGKKAQAKVLVVLLTAALYQSKPCLEEIHAAIENHIPLLPIRFEAKLPDKKNQWPQLTDEAEEVMISRVQKTLGKANDFPNPGTMLTMPSALDDVLGMIKHIVDPYGTNADTQDADTHHHGFSA